MSAQKVWQKENIFGLYKKKKMSCEKSFWNTEICLFYIGHKKCFFAKLFVKT